MTNTAQWLAENTGYCEPLNAQITRKQCQANKEKCFSCDGCSGLKEVDEMGKSKKTVAACKECGRVMEISGRGLCGKCYHHAMKHQFKVAKVTRTEPALPPAPVEAKQPEPIIEPVEPIVEPIVEPTDDPISEPIHMPDSLFDGLLPVADCSSLVIELDFTGDGDLYQAICAARVDQDEIIELLRLVFTGKYELRKVIA